MGSIVDEYVRARDEHHSLEGNLERQSRKVFKEYVKQKSLVSTRKYKPWRLWGVVGFKVKGSKVKLKVGYHGSYGYYEEQYLTLPAISLLYAKENTVKLVEIISQKIAEEGESISRRKKLQDEKAAEYKRAKLAKLKKQVESLSEEVTGETKR